MAAVNLPKLDSLISPNENENSPRLCERCNNIGILSTYRLGQTSIILSICSKCVKHYKKKQEEKGADLSSRDYTPRHV